MKSQRGCILVPWLVAALGFLILTVGVVNASEVSATRKIPVSLTAGQTYVIKDLKPNTTPGVHVLDNANALVINSNANGQLVLVAAQTGKWAIDLKLANGEAVTYEISVTGVANSKSPLIPGSAPPAMNGSSSSGSGVTSASPLDAGSGPVKAAAKPAAVASAASASAGGAAKAAAVADPPEAGSAKAADAASEKGASTPSASTPAASSAGSPPSAPAAPAAAEAGGSVMTSQAASQIPEKFTSNPLANVYAAPPAVPSGEHYLPEHVVTVVSGESKIFDFRDRVRRVSIADTAVADIQVINPYQLNLVGHKPGFTTLAVWDVQGHYVERQIRVDAVGKQQVMLNVVVAELNRGRLEQQGINYSAALQNYNVSFVSMAGGVATPYSTGTSLNSSSSTSSGSQSSSGQGLPFGGQIIPLLLSQNITYGLAADGQGVLTQTFFQFLEAHNLGKVLAEPHLLANSGEKAEFLSGGEIPIVIAQALNTSVVFKQFGTQVTFLPIVVGRNDIEMQVKSEVSEPDYGHGVQMFGFSIPAFVTRRAQTFVRLRDNQTLIIAGLILHNKTSQLNKVPYLGDMPFLGALFRNTSYQNQESDLIMSVTPQIVQPLPANGRVNLPTEHGPMTERSVRTKAVYPPDVSRPRF
jgi:Flp pilus assembly secretin CpaC